MIMVYYLPLYFQAIKGVSAVHSGISILPLVMSLVVASILAGALTARTGYYVPQLIACSIIISIGAGLITTLKVDTNHSHWIAYQFIYGFGLGLGMQQAGMAAQTCLPRQDVMTGVSIMFFMQGLGGSVFISIAQTVFTHGLVKYLGDLGSGVGGGLSPSVIVNTGATELRNLVPEAMLGAVLTAYNRALSDTFKVALGCGCASIIAGLTMEWRSVKKGKQGHKVEEKEVAQENKTEGVESRGSEEVISEEKKEKEVPPVEVVGHAQEKEKE